MHINASRIVYRSFKNVKPAFYVIKQTKASKTLLVPRLLTRTSQFLCSMRWLVSAANKRRRLTGFHFATAFSYELLDAFFSRGQALQRRDEIHKAGLQQARSFTLKR